MLRYLRTFYTTLASSTVRDFLKLHLRYTGTSEDTLIDHYYEAAVQRVFASAHIQVGSSTWIAEIDQFPCGVKRLYLPPYPLTSVSSIYYRDDTGATVEWLAANYRVSTTEGYVEPEFDGLYPSDVDSLIQITYVAGYSSWATVPVDVKQAICFLVEHYFDQRAPVGVGISTQAIPETLQVMLDQINRGDEFLSHAGRQSYFDHIYE